MRVVAKVRRTFEAVVESLGPGLGWTIARVPFVPAEAWPEMVRLRVKGVMAAAGQRPMQIPCWNGEQEEQEQTQIPCGNDQPRNDQIRNDQSRGVGFRSSLFPLGGGGYFVLVTRAMQRETGVRVGGVATIWLEPDLEARPAELPDELAVLMEEEPGLREWYDSLSEYTRREIGKWVLDVKTDAARLRRVEQMAERLLATMEAERELPPVVRAAFKRRPKAEAGWAKMTATQRRTELFAVNYYQTVDAREKRVEKLCEVAEKKA